MIGNVVTWRRLKRGILFFWAIWFTVVFLTNLFDGLKAAGWLSTEWTFASGNFDLVLETTSSYTTPLWIVWILFAGVVVWEGVAATLFWVAGIRYREQEGANDRRLVAAFASGFLLWAGFLLAAEVFAFYAFASAHMGIFVAQAISLLLIALLPNPGLIKE